MGLMKLTISRKILLLVGFVSLISGLAGILPLYLGSFVALESSFSNLLTTSTQTDASMLNKHISDLDSNLKLVRETFLDYADSAIAAYAQAEERKEISSFKPIPLRSNREFGSQYEALLAAAGDRGFLIVANEQGRICANTRDVFSIDLSYWLEQLPPMPPTAIYYALVDLGESDSGVSAIYLLMIKPLWGEPNEVFGGRRLRGAVVLALDTRDIFQRAIGMNSLRQVNNVLMSDDGKVIFQPTGAQPGIARTIQANLSEVLGKPTGWYWADVPGSQILIAHAAVNILRQNKGLGFANREFFVVEFLDVSDPIAQNSYHLWRTIPLGLLLIGLLCMLGAAISYRIVKPLKNLQRGVERLRRGDLDHRVAVKTGDELAGLAESFNRMAQTLKETYNELETKIRETDEKRSQLAIINEVIKATTQALEAERSFKIISREVGRMVHYDRMSLSTINLERAHVEFVYVIPEQRETLPKGHKIPLDKTIISLAVANRTPIVIELHRDSYKEFEDGRALYEVGARSLLIVPLSAQEGIVGSLNLASERPGQYGQREIDMILQVADTMAVAIEHARLYTRIARFAEELEEKVKQRTAALENAQQKLIQTEKFAATGRLAANIAHEINNPLGIIKNYIYLLSESVEHGATGQGGDGEAKENLRIIREEIDRIARIVRRLLDFYKRPDSKPAPTDVNREVEEMFYLTRKGLKRKDVRVEKDLAADLPTILASPDKIRQVILNLLRNAEDAVPEKGWIKIATNLERLRDDRVGKTGDYIVITVSDNGCGIPEANLRLIFDPFFTTKQESGTGLGLSITYGIVESLGGWIEVDSEVGKGTTFRIILPVEPMEHPYVAGIGPREAADKRAEEKLKISEAALAESKEKEEPAAAAATATAEEGGISITLGGVYEEAKPVPATASAAPDTAEGEAPVPAAEAVPAAAEEEPAVMPFDELVLAGLTFGDSPKPAAAPASSRAVGPSFTLPKSLTTPLTMPLEPLAIRVSPPSPGRGQGEPAWPSVLESLGDEADADAAVAAAGGARRKGRAGRAVTASEALAALDVFMSKHGLLFLDYGDHAAGAGDTAAATAAPARTIYDELFGDTSMPKPAATPPQLARK